MFVATSILLSRQNFCRVATKMILVAACANDIYPGRMRLMFTCVLRCRVASTVLLVPKLFGRLAEFAGRCRKARLGMWDITPSIPGRESAL